jgi:hypothetical protein
VPNARPENRKGPQRAQKGPKGSTEQPVLTRSRGEGGGGGAFAGPPTCVPSAGDAAQFCLLLLAWAGIDLAWCPSPGRLAMRPAPLPPQENGKGWSFVALPVRAPMDQPFPAQWWRKTGKAPTLRASAAPVPSEQPVLNRPNYTANTHLNEGLPNALIDTSPKYLTPLLSLSLLV